MSTTMHEHNHLNHDANRPNRSGLNELAQAAAHQDDGDELVNSDREQQQEHHHQQQQRSILSSPPSLHSSFNQPQQQQHQQQQQQHQQHALSSQFNNHGSTPARRSPPFDEPDRGVSPMSQQPSHPLLNASSSSQTHHVQHQPSPLAPPPFGHGLQFQNGPAHHLHGANIRNMRPMTAPSSVSAPYFHGGLYGAHAAAGPSSFFADPNSSLQYSAAHPFSFHVDSGLSHQPPSTSAGILPTSSSIMTGTGVGSSSSSYHNAVHDQQRHHERYSSDERDGSGSIFQFGVPPRTAEGTSSFYSPGQQDQDVFSHSRPTTADSRPGSSHTPTLTRGPGSFPYSSSSKQNGRPESAEKQYNFVSTGNQPKRPRRRYDEIERLYNCDYPGCQKAYGTLNHLNSHKSMQKHGPKSTPAQFKEMRKAWRENKKMQAALAARNGEGGKKGGKSGSPRQQKHAQVSPVNQRARPSTSAGEYHYNTPAPFLPPPQSQFGHSSPVLQLPPPPPSMYGTVAAPPVLTNPWGPSSYALPPQGNHSGSDLVFGHGGSGHRPVTAPNYFNQSAPSFGFQPRFTPTSAGMGEGVRRSSLPSEIQQPTPIFGFSAGGGENGFTSIQEEEPSMTGNATAEPLGSN